MKESYKLFIDTFIDYLQPDKYYVKSATMNMYVISIEGNNPDVTKMESYCLECDEHGPFVV